MTNHAMTAVFSMMDLYIAILVAIGTTIGSILRVILFIRFGQPPVGSNEAGSSGQIMSNLVLTLYLIYHLPMFIAENVIEAQHVVEYLKDSHAIFGIPLLYLLQILCHQGLRILALKRIQRFFERSTTTNSTSSLPSIA